MNKKNDTVNIALMAQDIRFLRKDVGEIKARLEADFVSREEFEPIKRIVYGLITLLLAGVITAMLSLIIRK